MEKLNAAYEELGDFKYTGHTGEIENVLTALETGTKPFITGEDGRKTVELITAIYKSGFQKRTVTLPITKEDEYYTIEGIRKNAVYFYKKTSSVENFAAEDISVGNYQENDKKK